MAFGTGWDVSKRIAFLLPDLRGGGVERLTIDLLAGCIERGHAVDLVVLREQGDFLPLVPDGVRTIELDVARFRDAALPLRRYLKEQRPHALIAAMWPLTVTAIVAAARLRPRPRIVVSDHAALRCQYAEQRLTLASMVATMRTVYRFADGVVGVSDKVSKEIARHTGLPASRVTTIHNPVGPPLERARGGAPWADATGKRILSVGTLKPVKNHRLLIRAFADLRATQEATLAIVGEGPERPALEAQVAEAGLQGHVLLPGFTITPGDWYRGADLFVLASDNEGFGNVLVEALHYGLSIVATDCPGGPSEILGGGRWGRLVPPGDVTALTGAMRASLASPATAVEQIGRAGEFGIDKAVDAYLDLALR